MLDKKLKKLDALLLERENLEGSVRALAENNYNSGQEIECLRNELELLVSNAKKIRNSVYERKPELEFLVKEIKKVLTSYSSYLINFIQELEEDCSLCEMIIKSGKFSSFNDLLDQFIEHKKELCIFKMKHYRLLKDLELLDKH